MNDSEWKFTDEDLRYLSRGKDQAAALARELLASRRAKHETKLKLFDVSQRKTPVNAEQFDEAILNYIITNGAQRTNAVSLKKVVTKDDLG